MTHSSSQLPKEGSSKPSSKSSSKSVFYIFFTIFSLILLLDTFLITSFFRVQFGWGFNLFLNVWGWVWAGSFSFVVGEILSRWTGFFGVKWVGAVILGWLSIVTGGVAIASAAILVGVREPLFGMAVFGVSIGLTLWGLVNEWRVQEVVSFRVDLDGDRIADIAACEIENKDKNKDKSDSNFVRVVQLTDIHLNGLKSVRWTRQLVAAVNVLSPDVIVFTGDFLDTHLDYVAGQISELKQLSASHKLAVSGNHDFYSQYVVYQEVLDELGFELLDERFKLLDCDGQSLRVVGLPDRDNKRFGLDSLGLEEVLKSSGSLSQQSDATTGSGPLILLRHRPEDVDESMDLGVDLQLSGHTHGGQLPPWGSLVRIAFKYCKGLYEVGNGFVYTSRGTGTWGPPLRLFRRSEITVFDFFA